MNTEGQTRLGENIARADADIDAIGQSYADELLDEVLLDSPGARKRLFAVLGWAGAGFAAITALSLVLTGLYDTAFRDFGIGSAAMCVLIGLAGFVGVVVIASKLDESQRTGAHVLLWTTTLAYAVLINVFAAAFNLDGNAALGFDLVTIVAGSVAATGAAVLGILAIAIAIGFGPLGTFLRWFTFVGLVTGAVVAFEPQAWWAGLIGAVLLAGAVELTLEAAHERWHVPEPALAACLVAGVTAVVLLVIYTVVRFVLRLTGAFAAGVAEEAAKT